MVTMFEFEGTDPVEASREAGESLTKARAAAAGIKSFLFQASSVEEFDQRAEFGGVSEVLHEVADEYLGSRDQHAKLLSVLRREYLGGKEASAGAFAVCPTCEGRGSHVNPSIDSEGISPEQFYEDPDFEEDYFSGAYDVSCAECGGNRVVPQCGAEGCNQPAENKTSGGWTDHRDRATTDHWSTCYDHLDDETKEDFESNAEMEAEMAAERRMGA